MAQPPEPREKPVDQLTPAEHALALKGKTVLTQEFCDYVDGVLADANISAADVAEVAAQQAATKTADAAATPADHLAQIQGR